MHIFILILTDLSKFSNHSTFQDYVTVYEGSDIEYLQLGFSVVLGHLVHVSQGCVDVGTQQSACILK